jgi:hypothetical protein
VYAARLAMSRMISRKAWVDPAGAESQRHGG